MSASVKLTKTQSEVLTIIGKKGFYRAHDGYRPTKKLVELGLAESSDGKFGVLKFTLTPAGRAYLAALTPASEDRPHG